MLYHFHVTQVRRSAGSSVIASAAYRAGEKLYDERYGEVCDYTRKPGVIFSEIVLPDNAPSEYKLDSGKFLKKKEVALKAVIWYP